MFSIFTTCLQRLVENTVNCCKQKTQQTKKGATFQIIQWTSQLTAWTPVCVDDDIHQADLVLSRFLFVDVKEGRHLVARQLYFRVSVMYVMEGLDCTELAADNGTAESLWVSGKGQANEVDVVGVYRLPSQDDNTDDLFFKDLPPKLQPWIWGENFRVLRELVSRIPWEIDLKALSSISAGQLISTTSSVHRNRQFQNAGSQAAGAEGWFGWAEIFF